MRYNLSQKSKNFILIVMLWIMVLLLNFVGCSDSEIEPIKKKVEDIVSSVKDFFGQTKPIRSPEGLWKKLIAKGTAKENVTPVKKEPAPDADVIKILQNLEFVYQFRPPGKPQDLMCGEYYYVSKTPRKEDIIGWVNKDHVIPWDHRECLRFTPQNDRQPVKVYDSINPVQQILSGKIPGNSPISQEPPIKKPYTKYEMLLPVLSCKTFNIKGKKKDAYEIAYIHTPNLAETSNSLLSTKKLSPDDFKLDIIFVFDATKDMQDYIRTVRNVITKLTFDTSYNYRDNIRYGLLVYRDRLIQTEMQRIMGGPFQWLLKLQEKNFSAFIKALSNVKVAEVSSEDISEAVLDGLVMSIAHSDWSKNGLKLVVLIGNASGHDNPEHPKNPGRYTIDGIIHGFAASKNVRICAFRLPGATKKDENKFEEQLKRITQGSGPATSGIYRTLDQGQGFSKFFNDIETLLKDEVGRLEALRSTYQSGGKLPLGMNEIDRTIVLWNLQASQGGAVNMQETFSKGWIPAEINEKPVVTPYVMVNITELTIINIILRGVRTIVEGSGRKEFIDIITPSIKQLSGEFSPISKDTSIQEILKKKFGLPIYSNILKRTPEEFVNLKEHEKRWILGNVKEKLSILNNFLDDQENWITLGKDYMVGFLPINYLP